MRNKKYRPVKLWIFIILFIIAFTLLNIFLLDGWRKVVMSIALGTLTIIMPFLFTYYFEIKDDRIIIKHGLSSFNKKYRSSFKTRIILIDEIKCLKLVDKRKVIVIILKNDISIYFPIGGYFHSSEIANLIYDVNKQIHKQS